MKRRNDKEVTFCTFPVAYRGVVAFHLATAVRASETAMGAWDNRPNIAVAASASKAIPSNTGGEPKRTIAAPMTAEAKAWQAAVTKKVEAEALLRSPGGIWSIKRL